MLRRIPLLLFLTLSPIYADSLCAQETTTTASTAAEVAFIEKYRQAVAAFRADDNATLVAATRAVLEQVPDHAAARYLFAVGRARQGWLGDSAKALSALAAQGLTTRLEAEPAFAPLLAEDSYADLRRQLLSNRQTRGDSSLIYQLALAQFIPEGLARANDGSLLLGSVRQSQIIEIPAARATETEPETRLWASGDGLCSVLGLRFSRSGQHLYVATACMQQTAELPAERLGQSGIFVYRADGKLLAQHWLPVDGSEHVLGDVLEWRDGQLLTSDSLGGGIYRLDLSNGRFIPLVEPGVLPNPQGLALAADGSIYLADYQAGIFTLDPAQGTRSLMRLDNPSGAALHGIDGLVRCGDQLVVIQNGVRPNRIMRLLLSPNGKRITESSVLARGLAEWDEPTLGIADNNGLLYVANSHWPQFDASGKLPETGLDGPRLMHIELPACAADSGHEEKH